MFRLRIVISCLLLIFIVPLLACAFSEPVLPSEAAEKIKEKLGYALAPTYLPEGFEYAPGVENPRSDLNSTARETYQVYYKVVSLEEAAILAIIYPFDVPESASIEEKFGLEVPEDAVKEIDINGIPAHLQHGSWSNDTLKRIARLELPINPEWDYDGAISIRFAINVPDKGRIWVCISTVFPTDEVTDRDLIRIARSVVVVE